MDILFSIKKAITFFIEPLGFILTLLAIGILFLYKNKYIKSKFFISISFVLLALLSYPPIANYLISSLENNYQKYNFSQKVEYIHVLGSGHHENASWPISSQIGNSSLKRTLEGVIIYKNSKNPKPKLIFTGYPGAGNSQSNAQINAKFAKIFGVKGRDIIIGSKPKDTKEESTFAKSIIKNKPFVLVTSASHMPRAVQLFKEQGLNPLTAPTDFKGKDVSIFSLPNIESFEKSRNAIHETIGRLWAYLTN